MFNQNTIKTTNKENPFSYYKKQNVKVDDFGFQTEDEYIEKVVIKNNLFSVVDNLANLSSEGIYTREEISKVLNLEHLTSFMFNHKHLQGFIKLFSVKIDPIVKEIIKGSIATREQIVNLNKLPEYMKRNDNGMTEYKCQATEVPMSDLLRQINKFNKVKLVTPAITTLTPEKDKPDYILEGDSKVLFDMKGQLEGKPININKIAHDRAVIQGLSYYMIGVLNSDKIENLTYVTYYLLPLNYMLDNSKLITNGQYQDNAKNNYYTIKIDNVIQWDSSLLKDKLEKKLPPKWPSKVNKI